MRAVSVLLLLALSAAFILISAVTVLPSTTTNRCKPDQVYRRCGGCRAYCNDTEKPVCDRRCHPGCYCMKDFLELDGECIKKADCEACTGNMTYSLCSGPCPSKTCSNMKDTTLYVCLAKCEPGCACKPGYVVDNETRRCVLPKDCPKK